MNIVMLGAPGAGKGTYASKINSKYGIPTISAGDLIRTEIKNKTEIGKKAEDIVKSGDLIPNEVVIEMMKKKLDSMRSKKGVIFDGFPRTVEQAEALDKMLNLRDEQIDIVLLVDTPKDLIVKRLTGRRVCKNCGAVYNVEFLKPKVMGICDKCGKALYQREDDKPETVLERFETYNKETEPLIGFYEKKGILKKIDGTQELDQAMEQIFSVIQEMASKV